METIRQNNKDSEYWRVKDTPGYIKCMFSEAAKERRRLNAAAYYEKKRTEPFFQEHFREKARKHRLKVKTAKAEALKKALLKTEEEEALGKEAESVV